MQTYIQDTYVMLWIKIWPNDMEETNRPKHNVSHRKEKHLKDFTNEDKDMASNPEILESLSSFKSLKTSSKQLLWQCAQKYLGGNEQPQRNVEEIYSWPCYAMCFGIHLVVLYMVGNGKTGPTKSFLNPQATSIFMNLQAKSTFMNTQSTSSLCKE